MAQPDYVPVSPADRVRQTERIPPSRPWTASRPGELPGLRQPVGESFGSPGPDQGYALSLAGQLAAAGRLSLQPGESMDDVVSGGVAVALKRASLFGRAPVVYDLELAFGLFGFLDASPPADLLATRKRLFQAAAHDYWEQREIADLVPEETLRLTPAEVRSRLAGWRSLVDDET
jgi:hypothetical protein